MNRYFIKILPHFLFGCLFVVTLLPWVILEQHCPQTIHDNLDCWFAYNKMFQDNHWWFQLDKATIALDGISSVYYAWANFSLQNLFYFFIPAYWVQVLIMALSMILAFYSLRYFLNYILLEHKDNFIIIGCSLIYCILPNHYMWAIPVASLPLLFVIFYRIMQSNTHRVYPAIFILTFYPFISSFGFLGIFILGLWFIATLLFCLSNRKLHYNLILGFACLTFGFIIVDLPMFYMRFILDEILNRSVFTMQNFSISEQLYSLGYNFLKALLVGFYHGSSLQTFIIFPVVFITYLISCSLLLKRKASKIITLRSTNSFFKNSSLFKLYFYVTSALFLSVFISALGSTQIPNLLFSYICPPLEGLSIARFFLIARILWYVSFAVALCIWFTHFKTFNSRAISLTTIILLLSQFCYIVLKENVFYPFLTYNNYSTLFQKYGLIEKANKERISQFKPYAFSHDNISISLHEYYAENLFKKIKADINYKGEAALAFKLDPAILSYHGISTPGGYLSTYPITYMRKFRSLIEPELRDNAIDRQYFDGWGGRLYLFNRDTGNDTYTMRINPTVMRKDFNVQYVFSSVPIGNTYELNLKLHKKYCAHDASYSIYLYRT